MNPLRFIGYILIVLLTGCGNPIYMASRLPGLRQVSDSMNEKAFVDWMESDPKLEVEARVAKGHYQLLGLAIYDQKDYWIPGVAGHKSKHDRYDVTWHGVGGRYEHRVSVAESYMEEFNRLMLIERQGIPLDVYARGPKSKDYIDPSKKS